jgi:DNA-binding IclR family transcriptional regulator
MPGPAETPGAIEKVCAVLRALSRQSPQRLTSIATEASLNKATALRILTTLIDEGFVHRPEGSKLYELGVEARLMSSNASRSLHLARLAQPALLRLADKSGDTALLSVRREIEALYVGRAVGMHPLQPSYLQIGSRRLLGVGAGSLALLSWLPDAEVKTIINIVVARQPRNSAITRALLVERVYAARDAGYTLLLDAAYEGMGGVGVPVRDESGDVIAALSIGAATERILNRERALSDILLAEARSLSKVIEPPRSRMR